MLFFKYIFLNLSIILKGICKSIVHILLLDYYVDKEKSKLGSLPVTHRSDFRSHSLNRNPTSEKPKALNESVNFKWCKLLLLLYYLFYII